MGELDEGDLWRETECRVVCQRGKVCRGEDLLKRPFGLPLGKLGSTDPVGQMGATACLPQGQRSRQATS